MDGALRCGFSFQLSRGVLRVAHTPLNLFALLCFTAWDEEWHQPRAGLEMSQSCEAGLRSETSGSLFWGE